MFKPAWVTEQCLKWDAFNCCGDEDLFPNRCRACGRLCVLCYECDTFYPNLHNLSVRESSSLDSFYCPHCGVKFPDNFCRDQDFRPTFETWHADGLDALLAIPPAAEFKNMIVGSAEKMADFLVRGMRSTAKAHITGYRNLAELLIEAFPKAADVRQAARDVTRSGSLQLAVEWHNQLDDPIDRAYAILGITDEVIP